MPPNPNLERLIQSRIEQSAAAKLALLEDGRTILRIAQASRELLEALRSGRKVFLFGNGRGAAGAQEIAAELASSFGAKRSGLPAIALTVNTSCLTAIANDYSFDSVFVRQLEALASAGDVAIGIFVSGNSPDVVRAVESANAQGLTTIGMSGRDGGKLKLLAHHCICAPSDEPLRIREIHVLVGHILCEIVERELFSEERIPARTGVES